MLESEDSTSCGTFLLTLMYCSNWPMTCVPALLTPAHRTCGLNHLRRRRCRTHPRLAARSACARCPPSTSTLTVPSGSLSKLQHRGDGAHRKQVFCCRHVDSASRLATSRICLSSAIACQSADGAFGADKQRVHAMGIDHHVAQRKNRNVGCQIDLQMPVDGDERNSSFMMQPS